MHENGIRGHFTEALQIREKLPEAKNLAEMYFKVNIFINWLFSVLAPFLNPPKGM